MNKNQYQEEYNKLVVLYEKNKPIIIVDDYKIAEVKNLVNKIVEAKLSEEHHKRDNKNEFKRFFTGLLGEAAMEKYFGIDIIDSTVGNSNYYNVADLSSLGLNIGIKTVEKDKFPIVHKNVQRPELINIKRDDKTVIFFGYATKKVLKECQDDKFILSKDLIMRGVKSAFTGFSELIPIKNLEELKEIYNKHDK